jgi:serine/threonine-protein kinase
MASVFSELKRRHVYRTAVVYAAAAWLLVQIATQVAPYFDMPNWSVRLIIVACVGGFPVAVLLSWFYEWSPSTGWRRELEDQADTVASRTSTKAPHAAAAEGAPPSAQSIAVLAFADMSQGKDQEYFSDGLAEELLNLLAQLPQLRVIARTSSFAFKGKDVDVATIARTLHVANSLEGSVRKSGNMLRITAQLVRATDSSHLWSQTYDRELTDVFVVQDEIAHAVVEALKVRLLPQQALTNPHRTTNTMAHDQYLLGKDALRRGRPEGYRAAVTAFRRSIELDPDYATAHAALAQALDSSADFVQDCEQRATLQMEALAAADRTIKMAPHLADGYIIRGRLRCRNLWNWSGALSDLKHALELDPSSGDARLHYVYVLFCLNRPEDALAVTRKVTEDDPLSGLGWFYRGGLLRNFGLIRGDAAAMAESRVALQRALDLNPESSFVLYVYGGLDLLEGKPDAALAIYRRAGAGFREAGIAMAEHSLGHEEESDEALNELEAKYANGFSTQIAEVHGWRNEIDAAFAALDRACTQSDAGLTRILSDPFLRSLHADPRWAALLERLAFVQA